MRSNPLSTSSSQQFFSRGVITGTVEKRVDSETYLIKTASGILSFKLNTDQLMPGDRICISLQNGLSNAGKNGFPDSTISIKSDEFTHASTANSRIISLLRDLNISLQSGIDKQIIQTAKAVQHYLDKTGLDNAANHDQIKQILLDTEKIITQNKSTLSSDATYKIKALADTIKSALYPIQAKSDYTFVLQNESGVKEGFYSTSSIKEALLFLNASFDNKELVDTLSEIIAKDGKIVFRIQGNTAHYLFASIVSPQAAFKELISFINSLNSSLMQSFPPETVKSIFESKSFISLDLLKNLDEIFKSSSVQFPDVRAGSKYAGLLANFNWISSIIDSPELLKKSADLIPAASASKIISDVKTINNILSSNHNIILPQLELPGITDEILQNSSKSEVISLIIDKLGYNLESRLLERDSENTLQSSIKTELLKLSKQILEQSGLNIKEHQNSISNPLQFEKDSVQIFSSRLHEIINDFRQIEKTIDSQPVWNSRQAPPEEIKSKLSNIIKTFHQLENYLKNNISSPQINDTMKSLQRQFADLIQLVNDSDKKSEYIFSAAKNKFTEILSTLKKLQIDIGDFHKKNPEVAHSLSARQLPSSDQNLTLQNFLRQTIESSINRLESLQLLARQIPSSEGQQQMLALPIKIGDEWTEVNISFFKKQPSAGKKKKSQSSTFSVLLNVSPKNLGSISIKMDYEIKKNLKIAMNFELESAKNYFQKFECELKSSLKSMGLPISFIEIRKKRPDSEQKSDIKLDTVIDMKV